MLRARALALRVPGLRAPRTLVEDLDFGLRAAACCALLGRNGSGKSSLLLALAGLRQADAGEVLYGARPLSRTRARAREVAVLLQDEDESFWGSTLDYVALGRLAVAHPLRGIDEEARSVAMSALRDLDMEAHAGQPYRSLSGGERQRARLAQTFVQDTPVLLLDEPLTHLDLGHQRLVMERLAALARGGRSVLLSLHEPMWAASYCSEALLLYDAGRFRHGPTREVMTLENLEALYGCRLESIHAGDRALYIPAA
jgi:ABC-type cobalamin/Fe3+-siderophores transport system ATPase subunit